MTLGDRIKERRAAAGLTLEEVAKPVGVTRATIQKYENGVIGNIPSDKIELLARALKTTPAYLMGWEEEEKPAAQDGELSEVKKKILDRLNQMSDEKIKRVIALLDVLDAEFK